MMIGQWVRGLPLIEFRQPIIVRLFLFSPHDVVAKHYVHFVGIPMMVSKAQLHIQDDVHMYLCKAL